MGRNRRFRHKHQKANSDNNETGAGDRKSLWQQDNWNKGSNTKNYETAEKHNALFEKYYQNQGLVPPEEWDQFLQTLREHLPVTFRITGNRKQAKELLRIIQSQYLSNLVSAEVEGQAIDPPRCLEWYPDGLAWQLNMGRKALRSNEVLKHLHEFLVTETESGNISRQEAVSMIPPLLLDIQPHHKILDLCAAPGSKTAQLIEYLHAEESESSAMPEGVVVANDVDNKRCYLMVHQVKRIQSPNCVIVNHDATYFPNIQISSETEAEHFIQYDRILADVPCSGDGTMRKNPDVWTRWNPAVGYNMHHLQLKIFRRALELLAVGGRLVYSTCSLNPVEDEAVVATMLQKCEGSVELVNVDGKLPGLKKVKGLITWKCMSKTGEWYGSYSDVPDHLYSQVKPNMFPPPPEVAAKLNLDRCVRVLPHHQNSGGFFIAVLQKTQHLPWTREARLAERAKISEGSSATDVVDVEQPVTAELNQDQSAPSPQMDLSRLPLDLSNLSSRSHSDSQARGTESAVPMDTDEAGEIASKGQKRHAKPPNPPAKQPRMRGYKEDPFLFLTETDPVWPSIRDFYSLSADFPVHCLLYRSKEGTRRSLYYVCQAVRDIVENNRDRIRFINMGVKILSRGSSPLVPSCDFRTTNEGIVAVSMLFPGRHVSITRDDAITILSQENPYLNKLVPSTEEQLSQMEPGSVIFNYKPNGIDPRPDCEITFCGWRGKNSVRSFVAKDGRRHNLLLFGVDLEELNTKMAAKKLENYSAPQDKSSVDPPGKDVNEKENAEDSWQEKETGTDDVDKESESSSVGGCETGERRSPMDLSVKTAPNS